MMKSIALVGNPNCGKTTLFNALTGSTQLVGNWPGVTVERKSGYFTEQGHKVEVVDLPGVYSLTVVSDSISIDENIACDYILTAKADLIVNIIDATNLERNLYVTTQLLEMGVPLIIMVNMMDIAKQRGIHIDLNALAQKLACPVLPIVASKNVGISALKDKIVNMPGFQRNDAEFLHYYSSVVKKAINTLQTIVPSAYLALRLLEGDVYAQKQAKESYQALLQQQLELIRADIGEDADIVIADARYTFIQQITQQVVSKGAQYASTITAKIDKIVLNRFLGIPIFLTMMYLMFLFAINFSGVFQDLFKIGSDTIFTQGLAELLTYWHFPVWFIAIVANGIGKGINTTVTFIPIIGGMFLFLSLLEASGYMARAAFVMDRCMHLLGLPGKSFVPLIVGFGCNVPGIMAARTLENKRERILTVMMSPFMSCGARLAIFAVFITAFFPMGGANIVFALYLTGIIVAILTGLALRKTLLTGTSSPLVMELPPYHMPNIGTLLRRTWMRLRDFLWKAGRVILPVCILIGALNSVDTQGNLQLGEANQDSLLSVMGRSVTPVFAPMGIQQDNWPATVGLMTGTLAKEVVVGTLNTLYSQVGHLSEAEEEKFSFGGGLKQALLSIPTNFAKLSGAFANPVLASAPIHDVSKGVYGQMAQRFNGKIAAFAYLLFVLLYVPCVSTVATIAKELGCSWAAFSVIWGTSLAYALATGFYQIATFAEHPLQTCLWVSGILLMLTMSLVLMRFFARNQQINTANYGLISSAD